jgi:spore germination protein GerM
MRLLLQGPTQEEFATGLRSAISPQTTLHAARVNGDTAVVDLSGAFVEVGGQEQILAVAQIVLTAASVPGVTQVRFLLDGEAVGVPRADGTLTSETLRTADYQPLLSNSP